MECYPQGIYRPRDAQATPLYHLVEDNFDELERVWDERYEKQHGFWRPIIRHVVEQYLECGDLRCGFARLRCASCRKDPPFITLQLQATVFLFVVPSEADPLICERCGGPLKIISLIDSAPVIERILRHLKRWNHPERPPPPAPERSIHYDPEVITFDDLDQRLEPTQ